MLRHNDIIDKLTDEQKISLLTDTREGFGESVDASAIPTIALNELWEENLSLDGERIFPSPCSLANSWDEKLFGNVAKSLASVGAGYGDNLFILPSASAPSSVYGCELAEEPYLTAHLVSGMARKMNEVKIPYCLRVPQVRKSDVRFLDAIADESVVYDRIARPFKVVQGVGAASAILLESCRLDGGYGELNREILADFVPRNAEKLIKIEDGDTTAQELTMGNQILGGSSLVVSTALENYRRIYRSMEEGGATAQELQMTLADGAAISDDIINEALDRKLELAQRCSHGFAVTSQKDIDDCALDAARKSIVLVKNENKVLPLRSGDSLALVGDIINDSEHNGFIDFAGKLKTAISSGGNSVKSFERGYRIDENVSTELIEPAAKSASGSTAIAFVGLGTVREGRLDETARLALPGNQIAMLTRLRKSAKRLIVVVIGERLPEMSFDSLADAILLVPSTGAFVAKALWEVLSGSFNPCGKLAYAGYPNVDTYVREVQRRKRQGKQQIGPFIGYRYADSNGERTKYPVGFGLSYTSFEYSKLHIDANGIASFSVKNTGRHNGCEVAQLYVSAIGSGKTRPRKELKGAVRIELKAGEKKSVTVPLRDLEIYDSESKSFVTEAVGYEVMLCSSANEIRSTRKINLTGKTLKKGNKRLSDYLQNVSNIVSEGYTMEAYCKPMNTKSKLKSFGAILLLTTLFADVIYLITCFMKDIPFTDKLFLSIFLIVNGVLLLISFICMLAGGAKVKKAKRALEKQEIEATKELFKPVKSANVKAIDELFEDEFDMSLEAVEKEEVVLDEKDASTYTYMAVDTDIPTLCKELESHFAESGLVIAPKMARRILSAVMTSRLLVVRNAIGVSCDRIVDALARFFGTAPHDEDLAGKRWDRKSLLRYGGTDMGGASRPAPLTQAINSALSDGEKACFYGVGGVRLADLGDMLMPYVQYFGNPEIEHQIMDESGNITMPSNLWFVVCPAKDEALDDMPAFVSNLATVIDLEAQTAQASKTRTTRKSITCHQMDALVFRAKKAADIDEEIWKGVDTLESFVSEKTPYHIGNKLFLQMEKYLAIYNACEADLHEAMDCAVAGKLLPAIMNLLKGNEGMADVDLAQIVESIFGEDYAACCRNVIKRNVITRAVSEAKTEAKAEVKVEEKAEEPKAEEKVEETKTEAEATVEAEAQADNEDALLDASPMPSDTTEADNK
ncbi:MAG: glycoside hydrolase family 3 C-terminal domain-containing protein [Clostridia bacterium]|nr:glycoside hydrolase family 3 C-terminal domain-containing protein [Clostridia bacterium]